DQSRAAGADNSQRTTRIDVVGGQRQRIEHCEPLAIVELPPDGWRVLTNRDAAIVTDSADLDVDDARLRLLPQPRRRTVTTGQHVVRCNRGMSYETDFGSGRKEPRAQIVIGPLSGEDEGGICIVQLASHRKHLGFRELIAVEHYARGVSCEA